MKLRIVFAMLLIATSVQAQDLTVADFQDDLVTKLVRIPEVTPAYVIPVSDAFENVAQVVPLIATQNINLGTDVVTWRREVMIAGNKEILTGTAVVPLRTRWRGPQVLRMDTEYLEVTPGEIQAASVPVYATRVILKKQRKPDVLFSRTRGEYYRPAQRWVRELEVPVVIKSATDKYHEWLLQNDR